MRGVLRRAHTTTDGARTFGKKFVCELVIHQNNSCRECRVRDDDVSRYWKSRHIKNAMRRFVWGEKSDFILVNFIPTMR